MSRIPKHDTPHKPPGQRHVPPAERGDTPDPMAPDRKHGLEDLDVTEPAPIDVERRDSGQDADKQGG